MRTLFLNPPSFEGFDGGASSRWPATREIESYWYPVWLCYPAGMLPDSKVVDAPPHKISIEQTVAMAKDFELLVLFTSTPGLAVDIQMAEMMKDVNPKLKVCFVGPPVTVEPEKILGSSRAIDFVVRREFDHQIVDFANGKPLEEIPNVSYRRNGEYVHNPEGGYIENLDDLPWVTKVYKRDLDFRRYNVPFLKNPFISLYTSRGCPALCTFCLWPQTHSGHRWRLRSNEDVANEVKWALENFDGLQEIFFDDDTFNYKGKRTIELCEKLGPLNFTWSCTSRVTTDYDTLKAMKETGCRQDGGSVSHRAVSISGLRRNNPLPVGTSLSLISASQAGCTQSPVPTTAMPLRAAHQARCSRSRSRLVAREYFEWTCRSARKVMGRRHSSCGRGAAGPPPRHRIDSRPSPNGSQENGANHSI